MEEMKCKSCGGELEKDGNIYVCTKCGEAYKNRSAVTQGNKTVSTTSSNFKQASKGMSCDVCGSANIVKQDGVFICQGCGTRYSLEEIRKMVGDNPSFSGNNDRLNNLYQVARRARDEGDDERAEKYYDLVLQEDANSWEAVFYSTYCRVSQSKIGQISHAADKLANSLSGVFNLIDENVPTEEQAKCITQVFLKTKDFGSILYSSATNHYQRFKETSNADREYFERCISIYIMLCELGDQLEKRYIDNAAIPHMCVEAWKLGIKVRLTQRFHTEKSQQEILEYADKVKKYDPSYAGITFKSGGCYVATCVYGSYDCPQVWTLRRYRDYVLDKTWYGRAFIATYYAISPTLVKWFGNTAWFKKLWKNKLDRMVQKLNALGYKDTKYIDKF